MLAAVLSALGIFLRAPLVGLPIGTITGPAILLPALAAAVIARMESLPIAFGAGIALGVVDLSTFYSTKDSRLSTAIMLPVILVALLLQRKPFSRASEQAAGDLPRGARAAGDPRGAAPAARGRAGAARGRGSLVAVVALGLPFAVGPLYRNDASLVLVYALLGLSLVVLTGWAGQISLGQFAFLGIGAAVAGGLAADANADFFVAVFAAGAVGAVIAVLVGLPALRMPGLFLAVTTLAFAATTSAFFLNRDYFGWLLPEPENEVLRPVLYGRIDVSRRPRLLLPVPGVPRRRRPVAAGDAPQPHRPRAHRRARQPPGRAGVRRGARPRASSRPSRSRASSPPSPARCSPTSRARSTRAPSRSSPASQVFAMVVVGGLSPADGRRARRDLPRRARAGAGAARHRAGAAAHHRRRAHRAAAPAAGRLHRGACSTCATTSCARSPPATASTCRA